MLRRLAWITTGRVRGSDVDEPPALAALAAAGVGVDVVDWDDPAADWAAYDRAVLRSTWDYVERLPEFLRALDVIAAATDLRNPAAMVRWSTDKHYLGELAAAGLPVVPSTFVEPGERPHFRAGGVVVKPAVGAGSRGVATYDDGQLERAEAHVAELHAAGSSVLLQPLLRSVAREGEWPLVFFGGRYSHAANKRVELAHGSPSTRFWAPETNVPHEADAAQVAAGEAAVAFVSARFGTPTYARVDVVRADDGSPQVLEMELVEPSLFLPEGGPAAVGRLVEALLGP